jgi:pSer/pThr/pTyr-binding forkhead associated (FHA) protein
MRKNPTGTVSDQATLVVTYGNTSRKHLPLDRDLVTFGRGRSCDVALASPEVATVHCVLARVAQGWQLRDCTGRGGTRLNGQPVTEALLNDGDVLHVGPFSFAVSLPPGDRPGNPPEPESLHRLNRSRRNLAHLALGLRKRLRIAQLHVRPQEELDREADRLRAIQRDWETRRKHQEQAEAAARADQEARERALAARHEQVEREAAARVAQAEQRLQEQARELAEAQRHAEESKGRRVEALQQLPTDAMPPSEVIADLEKASRRLARFATRIRRCYHQLHDQATAFALQQQQAPAVASEDLEGLRERVAELEKDLAAATTLAQAQEAELAALQALGDAQAAFVEHSGGVELQRLIASLREQVKDRDLLLEKMNQKLAQHSGQPRDHEMADYEEELNEYRRELEHDRREMNEQMVQLQERQQDMEDALREAELQMAKERAQIAREQAELNRLRQELSHAEWRSTREAQLRERLAGLRQPKEESAEKPAEQPEPPKPTRLRNILNLFS